MILGIDASTFLEQQRIAHTKYYKNAQEVDPFKLFKDNGVTILRTRIWNDPYNEKGEPYLAGTCDVKNFIELAKRVEPYGFEHIVDFHYSDLWADPAKQFLPKAWKNYSYEEIVDAVYQFTKESLTTIKNNGINVKMVQVGNEITHGILWPFGKLDYDHKKESFDRYATILKSGIKAVKEVYPEAQTILHLEQSYDQVLYRDILTQLRMRDVDFDVIGTSYYPFWHHGFDEYFANMDMIQREFGLPVMNVELGFPFTLVDYRIDEATGKPKHLVINADNIEDYLKLMPFYPDKEGQAKFVETFLNLAKEHNLLGACYWEPTWIPGDGICWASEDGQRYQLGEVVKDARNEWANQCLFDYEGNALPALDKYRI